MILLLDDNVWIRMAELLSETDEGASLVRELTSKPELPSDRELVRQARAGEPAPAAFARVAARRERAVEAAATTREELAEMVRHVHAAGVGTSAIARWAGLKLTRIYEILNQARDAA